MLLVYFASDGCVDDIFKNHQFTSAIVVHFMNSATVCWIIKQPVFIVYVYLNHSWKYEHNQFQRHDEKSRHQRQFFQNLDNFYI